MSCKSLASLQKCSTAYTHTHTALVHTGIVLPQTKDKGYTHPAEIPATAEWSCTDSNTGDTVIDDGAVVKCAACTASEPVPTAVPTVMPTVMPTVVAQPPSPAPVRPAVSVVAITVLLCCIVYCRAVMCSVVCCSVVTSSSTHSCCAFRSYVSDAHSSMYMYA
jgi:hypothetical protein